jgi:hypothetical protein
MKLHSPEEVRDMFPDGRKPALKTYQQPKETTND